MPDSAGTPEEVGEFLRALQQHERLSGLTRPELAQKAATLERKRYNGRLPRGRTAWVGHSTKGDFSEQRFSGELNGTERFPRWDFVLAVALAYADHYPEPEGEVVARLEALYVAAVRAREAGKAMARESGQGLPSWLEYNTVRGERDQAREAARVAGEARDDARAAAESTARDRDLAVEGRDEAWAERARDRAQLEVLRHSYTSLAAAVAVAMTTATAVSAAATAEHERELERQQQRVDELDRELSVLRRELAEGQRARESAELATSQAQAQAQYETRRANAQERRAGALRAEADRLAGDVEGLQRHIAQHGPLREDPRPEAMDSALTRDDTGPELPRSSGADTGARGGTGPEAAAGGLLPNGPSGGSSRELQAGPRGRRAEGDPGAAHAPAGAPAAASAPEGPPASVGGGRYTLRDLIGRGGAAEVYHARDEQFGRDVAVKLFPTDTGKACPQHKVQTLPWGNHPGLVTIYGVGQENDRAYLVMQLIEGESLADRIRNGALALGDVVALGADLADALTYVHRRGVAHRDITPGNVLLDGDGRPHLSASGIAVLADATDNDITATGMVIGTASYLSPEQVRGQPVGPASDVYALGLVLLECITGRREYPGNALEAAVARLYRPPQIPWDQPAWWDSPAWLGALLRDMTRDAPTQRPTAEAVVATLRPRQPVLASAVPTSATGTTSHAGSAAPLPARPSSWATVSPPPQEAAPVPPRLSTASPTPPRGEVRTGSSRPVLVKGYSDGDIEPIISDILSGRFVPVRDPDRYRPRYDIVLRVCAAALEGGVLLPDRRRTWRSGVSSRGVTRSGLTLFWVVLALLAGVAALILLNSTEMRSGLLGTVAWSAWPIPLLTLAAVTVAGYIAPLRRFLPATLLLATMTMALALGLFWSGPPWGAGTLALAALIAAAGTAVSVAVGRWRRAEMFYDKVADTRAHGTWGPDPISPALYTRLNDPWS